MLAYNMSKIFTDISPILKNEADELYQQFITAMPVALHPHLFRAGSAGHKEISHDMDVMLDLDAVLRYFSCRYAVMARDLLAKQFIGYEIRKSGIRIHVKFPYKTRFVQVDVFIVKDARSIAALHTHAYSEMGSTTGAQKHKILNALAKQCGYYWSPFEGLYTRNFIDGTKYEFIANDPNLIAKILLWSADASCKDLETPQRILDAVPKTLRRYLYEDLKKDHLPVDLGPNDVIVLT